VQLLGPAVANLRLGGTSGVLDPLLAEEIAVTVRTAGPDQVRQRLRQRLIVLPAFEQRLIGPFTSRDVAYERTETSRAADLDRGDGDFDGKLPAAVVERAELEARI
jgi:hypothetical protein